METKPWGCKAVYCPKVSIERLNTVLTCIPLLQLAPRYDLTSSRSTVAVITSTSSSVNWEPWEMGGGDEGVREVVRDGVREGVRGEGGGEGGG